MSRMRRAVSSTSFSSAPWMRGPQDYIEWGTVKRIVKRQIAKAVNECKTQAANAKQLVGDLKQKRLSVGSDIRVTTAAAAAAAAATVDDCNDDDLSYSDVDGDTDFEDGSGATTEDDEAAAGEEEEEDEEEDDAHSVARYGLRYSLPANVMPTDKACSISPDYGCRSSPNSDPKDDVSSLGSDASSYASASSNGVQVGGVHLRRANLPRPIIPAKPLTLSRQRRSSTARPTAQPPPPPIPTQPPPLAPPSECSEDYEVPLCHGTESEASSSLYGIQSTYEQIEPSEGTYEVVHETTPLASSGKIRQPIGARFSDLAIRGRPSAPSAQPTLHSRSVPLLLISRPSSTPLSSSLSPRASPSQGLLPPAASVTSATAAAAAAAVRLRSTAAVNPLRAATTSATAAAYAGIHRYDTRRPHASQPERTLRNVSGCGFSDGVPGCQSVAASPTINADRVRRWHEPRRGGDDPKSHYFVGGRTHVHSSRSDVVGDRSRACSCGGVRARGERLLASVSVQPTAEVRVNSLVNRPLPPVPTGEDVYADVNFADEPRELGGLSVYPWFHDVEREQVDSILGEIGEQGCFLVRLSRRGGPANPYTLSLLHRGRVFHLNIRKRPDGAFALGSEKPREKTFETVSDLIEYHRQEEILLTSRNQPAGSTRLTETHHV